MMVDEGAAGRSRGDGNVYQRSVPLQANDERQKTASAWEEPCGGNGAEAAVLLRW